jgi:3-dehydrosphinganine reductase
MAQTNRHWNEQVVLVTGGSSGIGLAAAKLFAASGAHVWLTARRKDVLKKALAEVHDAGISPDQHCGYVPADISNRHEALQVVAEVARLAGAPTVLFNSAGITYPGYFHDLSLDIIEQLMQVNYLGTVYMTKAVLPAMLERSQGHIINISSMAGYLGVFGYSAYGASKYAVAGFSESLRAELKPHGIRVSVAFPPDTDTPQLAFEEPLKPPETKAISGTAKALSPELVAGTILKQAARGRFFIFPGFDSRFFYLLTSKLPKGLVFAILDQMAAQGAKKKTA